MITIKDYANKTGKSVQAVYKQMKSSKNKARLNGHIIKENGITYLDDDAIAILNESRSSHIVIVDQN